MIKYLRFGVISKLVIPILIVAMYMILQNYKATNEIKESMEAVASKVSGGTSEQMASNWLNVGKDIDPDRIETAAGIEED